MSQPLRIQCFQLHPMSAMTFDTAAQSTDGQGLSTQVGVRACVHACVCAVFPVVANTDTPTDARCIGVANLLMCSADHGCCGVDSLSSSGYDQTGRTPLIIAVGKANGGMVHALLDHKASVNDKELKGARNAPLHAAYDCGDQEIVKVCCTRARVPWRAFVCVCLVALVHMGCMYVVPAK